MAHSGKSSCTVLNPLIAAAIACACMAAPAHAITLGQLDDFQDTMTGDWDNGGAAPGPENLGGGPLGAADRFMRINADGSGAGGKLTIFSRERWIGDYITPGVTAIEMDLRNFSSQSLSIRIAMKQSTSIAGAGYSSTVAYVLPNDGRWHRATFSLSSSALTRLGTIQGTLTDVLSGGENGAREFRILHSNNPSLGGSSITGQLGIDNIRAVPGPSAATLMALVGIIACRRHRRALV